METTTRDALPALAPEPFEPPPGAHPHAVEVAGWLLEGRFFTVDAAGAITMWSPPAAEAFAWSRRDIVQSRFSDILLTSASREAHADAFGALLAGSADATTFRADAVAVDANGDRMRVAFAAVPIHVGVGYEFNGLLQEIASSAHTERSLQQLRARGESVLALIEDAVEGRHAELAESEDAQRLAGALVVFKVLERSEAPVMGSEPDDEGADEAVQAELADALREAEESRARADSARVRMEYAVAESERLRAELAEAHARAGADAERFEAEVATIRDQHAAESSRLLRELTRSRETADAAVERLTNELESARGDAEEAARELAAARRDLTAARTEIDRHGAELEAVRASETALRAELKSLSADAAEARAAADRVTAELDVARHMPSAPEPVDAGGVEKAVEAARREAREAKAEAERLAQELAEARRDSCRLAAEVESAAARSEALQEELSALADQSAEACANADRAQAELEHAEAELGRVRAARDAMAAASQEEAAARDSELREARAELNAARAEADRLGAELETARAKAETAATASREENERLKAELDTARAELAAARASAVTAKATAAAKPSGEARPARTAKARASRYLDFVLDVETVPEEVATPKQRDPIELDALLEMAREVDGKNPYTRRHSERVAGYAAALAEGLGFERPRIEAIRQAALLHDVGKSEIREAIVAKDDPLNLEELEEMARHSEIGRELLIAAGQPKQAEWIRHVHERWDGGGHPLGLGGADIPEESRILHAVDALDHMTRPRAYRRNRPLREALSELAFCAGTRLDPQIARTLIDLVENGKVQVEGAGTLQRVGQPLGRRGRSL